MRNRAIAILLVVAVLLLGVAIAIGVRKKENPPEIPAPPVKKGRLETFEPSVTVSEDAMTCTVVVPAQMSDGVKAESSDKKFEIKKGDEFEIAAEGSIEFSSGYYIVGPEGAKDGYEDKTVDSPFYNKVGGLEFSVGPLGANRYFAGRYYKGKAEYTGVPVFRVIESVNGYQDGNYGAFTVTAKILRRVQK